MKHVIRGCDHWRETGELIQHSGFASRGPNLKYTCKSRIDEIIANVSFRGRVPIAAPHPIM